MNFCTIIAKNYLAFARVLARSLTEQHPESTVWTLIIDEFGSYVDPAKEPFEVLTPEQIGCGPFTEMALRYTVLELSTAVKPWLLRHVVHETGAPITYLDPDIKAYGSLAALDELAKRHGVVLIPHNSQPIPADGRKPSQVDILIAGVYNLGYISIGPGDEVDRLLDWWAERLRRDCRVDPVWGYFVDQRWFDLVPGFLTDLAIVRDPEYNVAYWNLHSHRLERDNGQCTVDGRPLAFFHFSGFDPARPLILSRHQNRIDVADDHVLEHLLAEYASEVIDEGHRVSGQWPYSYAALGDGTHLEETGRQLCADFIEENGAEVPSPFTLAGARIFDQWLREQAPDAPPGVSRALARVYRDRSDVRGAYPDLAGADREGLLRWAEEFGSREFPLLARAMRAGAGSDGAVRPAGGRPLAGGAAALVSRPSEPLQAGPRGVNVVGHFHSELGVGEAARQVVKALDAVGMPVLPIHSEALAPRRHEHPYATAPAEDAPFPLNILCLDEGALQEASRQLGEEFLAGRYSVGLWFWNASCFPEQWRSYFGLLEEVWAPSAYVAGALEPLATVPVHTVRIPAEPPSIRPRSREALGLSSENFLFLFSFDYLSVFERKNPLAAIDAFRRAFGPDDKAELVVKSVNSEYDPESHAKLTQAVAGQPSIRLIDGFLPPDDYHSLIAVCDSYVSLHRAEALGLLIAEAMWLGKPVIATGYSGNLDFMSPTNSLLVEHRVVPIGPGYDPYPADAVWAEPDIDHATALMRRLFDDRGSAGRLGTAAADDIRRTRSRRAAGETLSARLDTIRATGRARRRADPMRALPRAVSALPLRISHGPAPRPDGRGGAARALVRKTVLRAMKPYTAYQQTINSHIAGALGEVSHEVLAARQEAAAERARLMAEMRSSEQLLAVPERVEELKRILTLETDRTVYSALGELRHRHAALRPQAGDPSDTLGLTGFELRAFSQNGEDGVLAEILRRTGSATRFFVEFGVESGREGNCVYLADVACWDGLFIEAGEHFYRLLSRKYAANDSVRTIRAQVTSENVERLFEEAGVPPEPAVLSIDVDGQDYWIWEAIEGFRPRVVVIEYNSALDPRRRLVQPPDINAEWDGTEYYGASLGALRSLGERKGYRLVHTELSGVNAFFVRDDLVGSAFPDPGDVAVRGAPNYYQRGYRHPAALSNHRYLDLDTGALVGAAHIL